MLKDKAGQDATQAFEDIGHSPEAEQQMAKYAIGRLKGGKAAPAAGAGAKKTAGSGIRSAEETPLWKKLIVPVLLVGVAYAVSYYFAK